MMWPELRGFFEAIVEYGADPAPRLILADWLDENNRPEEAELMRLHVSLLATCCEPDKHPERVGQQARIVELLAAGVRPCLPQHRIALAKNVDMTFAWIPPGKFRMGSPPEEPERREDETQHEVTLRQGFYLGIHAVTQAQWRAVMGNNPSRFKSKTRPVERVSWEDCQAFCTKLSQREGKRYGLPSEAEWEYACRAGTTTPFHFGETLSTDQANYNGNYLYNGVEKGIDRKQTTVVGSFPPNAWGLFDLHGNVWEWCQDEYRLYEDFNTMDILETENMKKTPACCAAAPGALIRGTAVPRSASGARRRTATVATAFASLSGWTKLHCSLLHCSSFSFFIPASVASARPGFPEHINDLICFLMLSSVGFQRWIV